MANPSNISFIIVGVPVNALDPRATVVALDASVLHILTVGGAPEIDKAIILAVHIDMIDLMWYRPHIVSKRPRDSVGQAHVAAYADLHVTGAPGETASYISSAYAIPALN